MTYTTNSVKVAKNGIFIGYLDQNGAASQQSLNFDNKTLTLDSGLTVAQGNVALAGDMAVSGGVNMGGIAHIEGAASLSSTLGVSGATSLGSTLAVSGNTNLNSALNVAGTSHLVGALTQDGAATFGSTLAVTGATTMSSTLDVTGNSVFHSAVGVMGETHLLNRLMVDGTTSLDSTLDVSGATHLASTLLVDADASLGSTLTVSGAATMNSGMTVNGTSTTNGASVITGASSIGGALAVSGDANMASTLDVTGSTHLASTLLVDGTTHLVGALTQDGAASFGSTLAVTGATSVASTLDVTGATSVASTLDVTGATHLASTLLVDGSTHFVGPMTQDGMASFKSAVAVYGNMGVASNMLVDGTSHLVGALTQDGIATFNSNVRVNGPTTLASSVSITGASNMDSTLDVTGATHLKNTMVVDGSTSIGSSLNVTGSADLASTLNVTGNATFQSNMTVNGNLTVLGAQTSVNTTSLEVKDNAILIADANNADTIESGVMVQYKPTGAAAAKYAGMKRLPATGEFVFFKDANTKISEPMTPEQLAAASAAAAAAAAANNPYSVSGGYVQIIPNGGSATKLASYKIINSGNNGAPNNMYIVGSNDGGSTWKLIHHQTSFVSDQTIQTTGDYASTAFTLIRFVFVNFTPAPQQVANGHGVMMYSEWDINDQNGSPIGYQITNMNQWPEPQAYHHAPSWAFNVWNSPWGYLVDYDMTNHYVGSKSTMITPMPQTAPVQTIVTDVYATVMADSFNCASDARLKKDIKDLDSALDKMDKIRGVTYHWIDESQPKDLQVGVIAQEIQSVYPELVREGGNGFLSVDYPKLTAVLIQSVKELKAMVLDLIAAKQQ
jgi:hypothetical protein